jgi:hypothetical protein
VLLGGHVRGGADDRAMLGERRLQEAAAGGGFVDGGGGLGVGAGEAEVGDLDAAVGADEGVLRLVVAMDDAGAVGRLEAATGGDKEGEDGVPVAGVGAQPGVEALAADELHGDEHLGAEAADLEDGDDVGVGQAGHGLGLAEEAVVAGAGEAGGVEELEGDLAVEELVVGGINDAHAALAEAVDDGEAADLDGGRGGAEQAGGHQLHRDRVVGGGRGGEGVAGEVAEGDVVGVGEGGGVAGEGGLAGGGERVEGGVRALRGRLGRHVARLSGTSGRGNGARGWGPEEA